MTKKEPSLPFRAVGPADRATQAPPEHPIEYVVLDPALQLADAPRFAALFTAFAAGYAEHFTGDEAESTAAWKGRIAGKPQPQPVMRIVVAVERVNGQERLIGGIAAEFYRAAECVLVTYLYVSDEAPYRHRGHARALLREVGRTCAALGRTRALLAEAEWPELLPSDAFSPAEVASARARLRFFARLGARAVNIDYCQPALGADKRPVSYLRLLLLPPIDDGPRPPDDEVAAAVSAFLGEFYAALAQETRTSADEVTLARLRTQLHDRRPLTLPLPRLKLDDVALSFHFVQPLDGPAASDELLEPVRAFACPVFHSMETDLLSRAYRRRRLVRTVSLTRPVPPAPGRDAGLPVEIEFPERIVFQSENRLEERHWTLRRRLARAYLALSFFFDARVVAWHLTLKADSSISEEDARRWFDELDVIVLSKLGDDAGDQESLRVPAEGSEGDRPIAQGIRFRLREGDGAAAALDVNDLLRAVAATAQQRLGMAPTRDRAAALEVKALLRAVAAIAQLRLGRARDAAAPAGATVELLGQPTDATRPFFGIGDRLTREALCGIITGILDFDQIDDAEARDTLTPSVELEEALLRVHGATLTYVARADRAARTVAGSVGISPYLILPQATVLCDEWLLRRFESPQLRRQARSVRALSAAVNQLEDTLRTKWVPNPFFYPTEQKVYERALIEGGTGARRAKAEELLLELKTRLQMARETQRARFEAVVAGLLGAISALALDSLVVEVAPWLRRLVVWSPPTDGKVFGHVLTLVLAFSVGLVIYAWKRPGSHE